VDQVDALAMPRLFVITTTNNNLLQKQINAPLSEFNQKRPRKKNKRQLYNPSPSAQISRMQKE
jgi:hypothetical protein